jgi:hypothetical protein
MPANSRIIDHIARRNLARSKMESVFKTAGYHQIALNETPNQYWRDPEALPWFEVTTEHGFFVIGWRKRVISIEWGESLKVPEETFADQDVTKDHEMIHAWGYDKAISYLTAIRKHGVLSETVQDSHHIFYPEAVRALFNGEERMLQSAIEIIRRQHREALRELFSNVKHG